MDANTDSIMRKTAAYIEVTQTELDRHNEKHAAFMKRASETAAKLSSKGILPADRVDTFLKKIAENESEIWAFIERLADAVSQDDMGSKSAENLTVPVSNLDPFEARFFGELASVKANGMLE